MELSSLWGLPAHPLLVHAAVVLLPLAVIGALVLLIWPRLRAGSWGLGLFALSVVAMISVGLAQGSGEEFSEQVDRTDLVRAHIAMGESVSLWAILLVIGMAILVLVPWAQRLVDDYGDALTGARARVVALTDRLIVVPAKRFGTPIVVVAVLLTAIGGVGSAIQIVRVGHSGAQATWEK